jgi:serine/threonine protein kinase
MTSDDKNLELKFDSIVAEAADRFTEELQQGRSPSIEDYARRYPQVSDVIRQVFPALALLPTAPASRRGGSAERAILEPVTGMLGDFRVHREIGRGGMGIVYEAEQVSLGCRVALKVLPMAGLLDERRLQRFHNEAHAAASLRHPNILGVHAVGCERGVHYYAVELIEGPSLVLQRNVRAICSG